MSQAVSRSLRRNQKTFDCNNDKTVNRDLIEGCAREEKLSTGYLPRWVAKPQVSNLYRVRELFQEPIQLTLH
jgi:hypothetical protein